MRREIKFSYLFQHDETGIFCDKRFTLDDIDHGLIVQVMKELNRHSLIARRQFTGLKDKNGKEIYEGDIIQYYSFYSGDHYIKEGTTQVKWFDNSFDLADKNGEYFCSLWDTIMNYGGKIIGNIYENPELL